MSHTTFHVYVITCAVDGREYVGMTSNPSKRLYQHSRRGAIKEEIKVRGIDNFALRIISSHASRKEALDHEQLQIKTRNTHEPHGFNRRMRGGSYPGIGGAGKGNTNSRRKACAAFYPDGQEAFRFYTVLDAGKATGVNRGAIHRCFRMPAYTAGGYFWKRVDG